MSPPPEAKKHRALLIGRRTLDDELSAILGGYGYFVEHCPTRLEGARAFRRHRQSLVIVDVESIRGAPGRLFRFFRLARGNSIVLAASGKESPAEMSRYLLWGAHDVIRFPLRRDTLNLTLSRTSAYHRYIVRAAFYRNALYFGAAVLPLWGLLLYFALR